MKKMTLLAAMAVCGVGAMNAQLVDPSLDQTIDNGEIFDVFMLDNASVTRLQDAGKTVNLYNVDETTRHMYIWEETMVAGSPSNSVGVDFQTDGFSCFQVGTKGWSGLGLAIDEGAEIDLGHVSDDTHFHLAVRPEGNAPASIAVIIGNSTELGWNPASISVGDAPFNDGGKVYPLVGDFDEGGDWLAIDLTFGELKKLWPAFTYVPGKFFGNIISVLAGGVAGSTFSMDACYLYGPKAQGGVEGVAADEAEIVVSAKTVSVLGGEEGIDIYNVSGQLVKSTESTIVGVEDLTPGIYVVKAGNAVKKVVIR